MFITTRPISVTEFLSRKPNEACGAVVSFIGTVRNRDEEGKPVEKLYYECYETMANREIGLIREGVKKDGEVDEIRLLHRIGWLNVGEVALVIVVSAPHRDEAFSACRAVIDEVKKKVPIWKKEIYEDGTSKWVFSPDREGAVP